MPCKQPSLASQNSLPADGPVSLMGLETAPPESGCLKTALPEPRLARFSGFPPSRFPMLRDRSIKGSNDQDLPLAGGPEATIFNPKQLVARN